MRVFVTGGTGLIGSRLVARLHERGDKVLLLTRRPQAARERFGDACEIVEGDPTQSGKWMDSIAGADAVVNLAGESVFGRRWNQKIKQLLRHSRVRSTELVVEGLARNPLAPAGGHKVLVNASAIGWYGFLGDQEVAEDSPPGDDFLARLCIDWEGAAQAAETSGIRVVRVRVGVVLDKSGGALGQMLGPFKMFVGGPVGSGRQYVSWIHHADMVGVLLLALDTPGTSGPMNGTAPAPVTNKELAQALGRALHRPSFMPMPVFGLRMLIGEAAQIVASGQRVLPRRALELGYKFRFPDIDSALADILK